MEPDKDSVEAKLIDALNEVKAVIDKHSSHKADDDQYDDPELWWAYPVKSIIMNALEELES